MKSLFRIIRRYSLMAGLIILIILVCNGAAVAAIGYYTAGQEGGDKYYGISLRLMEQIGEEFRMGQEGYMLDEKGMELLEDSEFVWAMALDQEGAAVWKWRLPEEIPEQYSIQDAAVFSKWYLADYPVKVLVKDELLLVFGCSPDRITRHNLVVSTVLMEHALDDIKIIILVNLLVITAFILWFGYRFYHSMKPVAQGIEDLAAEREVCLKVKGPAGDLAGKLNEASGLLHAQRQVIARRDLARTEWIAGVSHDIRTPLSMIVGHSDRLSKDESLSEENRMLADNIRRQGLIIRQLIADLNLTSKLAYQAQPLKKSRLCPAALARSCAADFYNEGLEEKQGAEYEFEIVMKEELEQVWIFADEGLLARAVRNLIGNSIRHNPEGCRITVTLAEQDGSIRFLVEDTGPGIPESVVQNMENGDSDIHIMGLRLTDQIARAHGGGLEFVQVAGHRMNGNYDAGIRIQADGQGTKS